MPVGPNGEKRPVSPISAAVMAVKIATKQIPEEYVEDEETRRELRLAAGEERPS